MKSVLLTLGALLTACNLMIGIANSAVCEGSNGGRACGTSCAVFPDGRCACQGSCTAAEMKWVEGGSKGDEELLAE